MNEQVVEQHDEVVEEIEALETFSLSRGLVNYGLTALTFLVVGVVIGLLIGQNLAGSTEDLINEAVNAAVAQAREEFSQEVATQIGNIEISAAPSDGGNQQAQGLDTNQRYSVSIENQPSRGPEGAPIVIVEFSDYRCPFCGRFAQTTLPLIEEEYGDKVLFVYRDYPIIGGQSSYQAALAAECVNEQGLFWEYHDLLFANQQILGEPNALFDIAEQLDGLDMEAFQACFEEERYRDGILEDFNTGRELV
ncbi:MAG: hypothetical protein D6712_10525, partial [Chloroflexi bacterium]